MLPQKIEVRGARVHNLKNIDIDIPLHQFVAISGLSGSGKSSLAHGILYEEGSRRYLEALSTYTRRRLKTGAKAKVTSVKHIPSALALRQRPSIPSERATVGTMSELFNVIRLIFSRLGCPLCPNGHRLTPDLAISEAMSRSGEELGKITCPTCGVAFYAFSAEDFAFNSTGACQTCQGTGKIRQLDESKLIADETLSLTDGAIASWRLPGRNFMAYVAERAGVRIDVPYKELSAKEKDFVLNGPKKKYTVDFKSSTGRVFHDFQALYENAKDAVLDSVKTSKSERSQKKLAEFFHYSTCPTCHGTRLRPELLTQLTGGLNIAQVSALTLGELKAWKKQVLATLPPTMQTLGQALFTEFDDDLLPLLELGLDYLTLERNGNSLSTGELQRLQLARTLRTETTGVLYILDEPSIGLHPDNVKGLLHVLRELVAQGNSLVVVDHNVEIIKAADYLIEIGPGSGALGGQIIGKGTPAQLAQEKASLIGPYLNGTAKLLARTPQEKATEKISLTVHEHYNLADVEVTLNVGQLTTVTGFSGAGKTSLILDSLVPALKAKAKGKALPTYVTKLETTLKDVVSVDATPIGKNTRSTVATYTTLMDDLRKLFASQKSAKEKGYTASFFSYNNKQGACERCGGTGVVNLDIQYLPDMEQVCPQCQGERYQDKIKAIKWRGYSIVDLLALDVAQALEVFQELPHFKRELELLAEVGLGYLHLGESTPSLSGGEAQRLKLVKHLRKKQKHTLFVFDEPTIGLHPLDVKVLVTVMQRLLDQGATIITITHDLDLIVNADQILDLGPKGGKNGGQVIVNGTLKEVLAKNKGLTTKYLKKYCQEFGIAD